MKQNEMKNGQPVVENLASSLKNKEVKEKKTIVKKQESLTADERKELYDKKLAAERREELLSKMTADEKQDFLEKEKQRKFYAEHKACYLKAYSGHLLKKQGKKAQVVVDTLEAIKVWSYMLRLLENKEHISNLEINLISVEETAFTYDFNVQNMIYEDDCDNLKSALTQYSAMFEPMGDIVKERKLEDIDAIDTSDRKDDFNYEYNKENDENKEEIISKEDSSTNELNKKVTKELRKDNSVVIDLVSKTVGKSKAEVAETLKAG